MSDRDFWVGAARRLALRRHVAAWAEVFLPAALAIATLVAVTMLAMRLMGHTESSLAPLWIALWGALGLSALACLFIPMRRPFSLADALARLDEVGHLHNRLTSAHAGIGPWPAPEPRIRDTVRWNWGRLGTPVLTAGLVLAAAVLIEIPKLNISARPNEEPIAWTQLASWLQTLQQAKIIDQPALDKLKEQVEDLRNQPEKDWYSQSSLEAGDALRAQTSQSLQQLETNLEKASDLMSESQQSTSASELQTLSASLKEAVQGLASGNLAANKDLTAKLGSFDPSSLKSLSPQQLQELQQRLQNGAKVCSQCVGPNAMATTTGTTGQYPSGHPGGGGPADLNLDQTAENLHTKNLQGATNSDPSRALPAEVIAVAKGKHHVDTTTPAGPVAGGGISSAGQGGDAVWRESLTPDERQVLQNYFK
jgi:hypothetical protein